METNLKTGGNWLSRVLLLMVGMVVGGGLVGAHFGGALAPLYHKLGWHSAHESGNTSPGNMGGHVGHGGMAMGQKGGGESSGIPGFAIVKIIPERQR